MNLGYVLVEFSADCGISGEGGYEGAMFLTKESPTGNMSDVWAEVLSYACSWAEGDTSAEDCAYDCTFGLFYSQMFAYNLGTYGVPSQWVDSDFFMLSDFLASSGYQSGNCVDVSSFNSLCIESLGVGVSLMQQQADTFVTNKVCPIGSDSTQLGNYDFVPFSMHQQVHLESDVYDAALAFPKDLNGNTYMNPPAGWVLGPPGYWQTPTGPTPPPMYGLARRYWDSEDDWHSVEYPTNDPDYWPTFIWMIDPDLPSEVVEFNTASNDLMGVY